MIEEEKNEAQEEQWREQELVEFNRWEGVFPEMKYGEIWKEVAILEKWRQEKLDGIKKALPNLSDEEIFEILEDSVLKKGTRKRLIRLLISEDIEKISEQIDEILERDQSSSGSYKAERDEIYEDRKKKFEAKIEAVDNSKPFASIEKNQYCILGKLEEMMLDSFNSSWEVEQYLRLLNHSSLKSQLPLIAVLREMENNSHPARQFAWVAGAGTISGLVVGFVLNDQPVYQSTFKESDFLWTNVVWIVLIVGVPLFLLASIFKRFLKSFVRCFWKWLKSLY